MSDFDKEAERERLREQYERDQRKREATEHMSELLLKGATMTDAHCEECGDPIFRYDGQRFCPTCKREVSTGDEAAGDETSGDEAAVDAETEAVESDTDQPAEADDDARVSADSDAGHSSETTVPTNDRVEVPAVEPDASQPGSIGGDDAPAERGRPQGEADDVAAARASLRTALRRFADQAAATENPRPAAEALEAAREAAEALEAVEDLR